jgi:Rieske Fe-S protein
MLIVSPDISTGLSYKDWLTKGEVVDIEDIPLGEGRLVRLGLSKVATYRGPDGKIFQFSAVCPHLKALVHWNSDEKTWDCPAHGSRFNCFGCVMNGPANEDLAPYSK